MVFTYFPPSSPLSSRNRQSLENLLLFVSMGEELLLYAALLFAAAKRKRSPVSPFDLGTTREGLLLSQPWLFRVRPF
jgi:hypothetical protein